jgi:hypothetical protein
MPVRLPRYHGGHGKSMTTQEVGAALDAVRDPRVKRSVRRQTAAAALGSGAVLLSLLVVVGPLAGAMPVRASVVYKAPFSGTPIFENVTEDTGCAHATLIQGAAFNFTKGIAKGNANTTASTASACNSPYLNNTGVAEAIAGMSSQQFVATAGSHTVTVVWHLIWAVSLRASRTGSAGYLQTETEIEAVSQVYDSTTSTWSKAAEWTSINETNGSGSLHYHGNAVVTLTLTGNYTANEIYSVVTAIEVISGAVASPSTSKAYATADLNVASGGNKATLESFSVP